MAKSIDINNILNFVLIGAVGYGLYKAFQFLKTPLNSSKTTGTQNLISNPLISPIKSAVNTGSAIVNGQHIPQAKTVEDYLKYGSDLFQYIANPFALLKTKIGSSNSVNVNKATDFNGYAVDPTGALILKPKFPDVIAISNNKTTSSISNISSSSGLKYNPVTIRNHNVNGGVWNSPYGYVSPKDRLNTIKN